MKLFPDRDFLLKSETSRRLYHDYAAQLPIIDYHCHLPPQLIAENHQFANLTESWLRGDHYKWRAMRIHGIDESFITGDRSDREKFLSWAETVPYTVRNPLYHWTHLELQRYFSVHQILNTDTAMEIYDTCNELLQSPSFRVLGLLEKMKVEVICTTDDPADSLAFHRSLAEKNIPVKVLPAFRPDQAMAIGDPVSFKKYLERLEQSTGNSAASYLQLLDALKNRHDYFHAAGCRISDHGLEQFYETEYSDAELEAIFQKVISGRVPERLEIEKFQSALLYHLALWDHEKNWVQQFHLGALRNNNTRMLEKLGADTGWDSIGDFPQARAMSAFFNRLDRSNQLARTIIYNNNPADNEMMATMIGNFNDGSVAGKIQWGSGWWFMDQKEGMINQLNALSNMGLISHFVGMITDSRSFLSFPRHEYFRRILCELFGSEMDNGELPDDPEWIGKIIQDVCYYNARNYFGWNEKQKQ